MMLANDGAWNGQQIVPRSGFPMRRRCHGIVTCQHGYTVLGYGYQVRHTPGERRMFLLLGIK